MWNECGAVSIPSRFTNTEPAKWLDGMDEEPW